MRKIIISIALILGFSMSTIAQDQDKSKLRLFAKTSESGTMLKVIPQTSTQWLEGIEHGYTYYRKEVGTDRFQKLNQSPILPLKDAGFDTFEKGDSLRAFNQKAVFHSLAASKQERSPSDAYRYLRQREQEFAFYILVSTRLRDISMISGMEYIDENAEKGKAYVYKVEIAKEGGEQVSLYHQTLATQLPVPMLEAISGEKSIHLAWEHQDEGNLLCYYLERGEDVNSFVRLNETPIYPTESMQEEASNLVMKMDSVAQNYQSYAYRLVGLDVWGEEHQAPTPQFFMAVDKTAPQLPSSIDTKVNTDDRSITLTWQNEFADADFKACMVYYANERNGFYTLAGPALEDPQIQSFTMDSLSEFDRHYFKLVFADTNNNFSTSQIVFAEIPDIYPPAVPQGLKAEVDKEGVVRLSWTANQEKDLRSYMVYRSTNGKTNYLTITPMHAESNKWIDESAPKGLNKDVFYYIRALDSLYNYSTCSDTLRVMLPDTLAPVEAKLAKPSIEEKEIRLHWIPSSSSDVASQYLVVRAPSQQNDSIALTKKANEHLFKTTLYGRYDFQIISTDESGNRSLSNVRSLTLSNPKDEASFASFKAKGRDQKAQLEWSFNNEKAKQYLIYRKQKGEALELIATTRATSYKDNNVRKGSSYSYFIKAKDEQGQFLAQSQTRKVKL